MKNHVIKKYMQRIVALAALAFVPAVVASAQTPEERIDAVMSQAQEKGIPVSLLESKKAEGLAKGVPMNRIATAVQTRLQHLERAREAMQSATDVDAAMLSVGADAIGAGVSEAVLAQIATSTKKDRRNVALAALTYLVSQEGLASEDALARVQAALEKGPQALANLTVRAGAASGRIPEGVPPMGTRGATAGSGAIGPPSSVPAPGQGKPPVVPPGAGPGEKIDVAEPPPGGPSGGAPTGGQP